MTASPRGSVRALFALGLLSIGACDDGEPSSGPSPSPASESSAIPARDQPLRPLPKAPKVDPRRAALGAKVFSDPSVSSDGTVSCATCHPLDRAGADGLSHSRGVGGKETALNTPTIYNATYNFRFNWNGAYATLEDEFDAPITKTMSTTWDAVDAKLRSDRAFADAFRSAYPDGVTTANVKDALARYIDTLVTPDSRFDQYLRGDTDALTADERKGYEAFKEIGCSSCHQGANVGGNLFQRFGVMHDYFRERGGPGPTEADMGRFNTTKNPSDRHVFRVPSLRNVALTPPYFHDGSAPTLEHAVLTMGYSQLGRRLTTEQVTTIVSFLRTLTGVMKGRPE
ncbi:MAG TPA: cytochrome c peroxidase [Polyangiaceae bacterium]|nr:cytochrome c peroxidase [Polyangiaceae bacterium]